MPDDNGKAWFELEKADEYTFIYFNESEWTQTKSTANLKSLKQNPGFIYIDIVRLFE